jgi:hypothetical protein
MLLALSAVPLLHAASDYPVKPVPFIQNKPPTQYPFDESGVE